jgi:hypothetical protein
MSDSPPVTPIKQPAGGSHSLVIARGLGGALVGASAAYFLFLVLYRSGFYGIMLPGVLLGIGAGLAARSRSQTLGILCAVLAVLATIFTEWHVRWSAKNSLPFFLANIAEIGMVPLLMMALGVAAAYWFGQGR